MQFIEGQPIDQLQQLPQQERDRIMQRLLELFFDELFEFQLLQSDPNFANYQYISATQQVLLLDFGACTPISNSLSQHYKQLLQAACYQDPAQLKSAQAIGYFSESVWRNKRICSNCSSLPVSLCVLRVSLILQIVS